LKGAGWSGWGPIDIRGAKGLNAETINGIYEPTEEICSGWPVYRKRGDPNKWLEFFAATNKWYVKATTDKGRARGWMRISCEPPSRPELCKSICEVWDGHKWIAQGSVSIVTLKQRKEEDRIAGASRLANAVAVDIRGATGPSASSINGVYTPTDEICSGWPVYRKEGDPDKWLEYIIATNEWYVKPTADRGRSEGWMCLGCEPPSSPELSRGVCEVWDGEKWSVQNTVTVLTAACAFENMLEVQIFCAEETRELQERLNGMLGKAVSLLANPAQLSANIPSNVYSDKNNVIFSQTLQNILSGGTGNGSFAPSSGYQSSSSSASASGSASGTSAGPAEYISSERHAQGTKQLTALLADLDERIAFLHEQAEEEDLGEGDERDVPDFGTHECVHSATCTIGNAYLADRKSGSVFPTKPVPCAECGGLPRRVSSQGGPDAAGLDELTTNMTLSMISAAGLSVTDDCYAIPGVQKIANPNGSANSAANGNPTPNKGNGNGTKAS
jgi:hypothetical protein